jgi:hypothetical protein
MTLEELYNELSKTKVNYLLKNGKIYFNGMFNGKKFVRYIFEHRDTNVIAVYVCIDKPYGETQTEQDKKDSAKEKNRWIRDDFNTLNISFKLTEWIPGRVQEVKEVKETKKVINNDISDAEIINMQRDDYDPFKDSYN